MYQSGGGGYTHIVMSVLKLIPIEPQDQCHHQHDTRIGAQRDAVHITAGFYFSLHEGLLHEQHYQVELKINIADMISHRNEKQLIWEYTPEDVPRLSLCLWIV